MEEENKCLEVNLENGSDLPNSYNPNLIVASNIFNELNQDGQSNLGKLIKRLPEGSTALLIEPGDQRCAKTLMSWRKDMIAFGEFSSQGVCNLHDGISVACNNCWNSRRQSFHQTTLYRTFRKAANQFVEDKREFEDYENMLHKIASKFYSRLPKTSYLTYDDLFSIASEEFVKACEKFNPSHKTKFSTYLYTLATNSLRNTIRREIWWSRHYNQLDLTSISEESIDTLTTDVDNSG